jgi:hypothetical protein
MPTIFILGLFSLVISIMAAMISNGTSNVAVLTKQRVTETHEFFENIAKVAVDDITNTYYHANPKGATTPAQYIQGLSEMKRLSSGRLADPTLDAWGSPIQGRIVTEYQPFSRSTDARHRFRAGIQRTGPHSPNAVACHRHEALGYLRHCCLVDHHQRSGRQRG